MQKSDILKFLISMLLGMTLMALVAFNVLLIWVASAPRSLERFTPMFERTFSDEESGFKLDVGEAWLLWGGWRHPLDIQLKKVQMLTRDGVVFSSFPEISLGIDVLSLPFGKILPTSFSINKPIVSLKQDEDKNIHIGASASQGEAADPNAPSPLAILLESLANPKSVSSLRKLKRIELLNADVTIGNEKDGVVMHMPNMNFIVRKEGRRQITGLFNTVVEYGEKETPVKGQFQYNKGQKRLEGSLEFGRLDVSTVAGLLLKDSPLAGLQLPAGGKILFAADHEGKIDSIGFVLDGGRGKIISPELAGPVEVTSFAIKGTATDALKIITIENADIDFTGSKFNGHGKAMRVGEGLGLSGEAGITDVETKDVKNFWPPSLAPLTRDWVTTNIFDGGITQATVKFNIKPGDLELPTLPKEDIDAEIHLKDAKIRYLPNHPHISNVNSVIHVDGIALDAAISGARGFTDTKMTNGRLYIADLNPDNPLLEVSLEADAPTKDIVTLLGLPKLEHAKHLNLSPDKVSGRATGKASLSFYFYEKDEAGKETPITFNIESKLDKVSSPAFMKKFDIENASGNLKITTDDIHYEGSASVNGASLDTATVDYSFREKGGIDTKIKAAGNFTQATLKRFGYDIPVEITGNPALEVSGEFGSRKEDISATFRLAQAGVKVPDLNYDKPAGEAATFSIATRKKESGTEITSLSLTGAQTSLEGKGAIGADGKAVESIELSKLNFGRTKLNQFDYTAIDGGYQVKLAGESLDASGFLEKKGGEFSFEHFPAANIDMQIGTVYAANGLQLTQVKGYLNCDTESCKKANIGAILGEKKFTFAITPSGKGRSLNIYSDDAGGILRAFNILGSMYDGMLTITGNYEGDSLRGNMDIRDYTMKDAPVLAKLLSLASLTGFFDTLSGKGIAFKKLTAPFTLSNDVITLKDAKTYGPAIGMNADGTITFPTVALNLKGTIVPSYTLNTMVGKVPLLGEILTGGEGQGLIAANYSISGDDENPEVSVNPLSILTPGFLRHMFDGF